MKLLNLTLFLICTYCALGQGNTLQFGYGKALPFFSLDAPSHNFFIQYQRDIKQREKLFWGLRLGLLAEEFDHGYFGESYAVFTQGIGADFIFQDEIETDEVDSGFNQLATLDGMESALTLAPSIGIRLRTPESLFNIMITGGTGFVYKRYSGILATDVIKLYNDEYPDGLELVLPYDAILRTVRVTYNLGLQFNFRLNNNFNIGMDGMMLNYFSGGAQVTYNLMLAKNF